MARASGFADTSCNSASNLLMMMLLDCHAPGMGMKEKRAALHTHLTTNTVGVVHGISMTADNMWRGLGGCARVGAKISQRVWCLPGRAPAARRSAKSNPRR